MPYRKPKDDKERELRDICKAADDAYYDAAVRRNIVFTHYINYLRDQQDEQKKSKKG